MKVAKNVQLAATVPWWAEKAKRVARDSGNESPGRSPKEDHVQNFEMVVFWCLIFLTEILANNRLMDKSQHNSRGTFTLTLSTLSDPPCHFCSSRSSKCRQWWYYTLQLYPFCHKQNLVLSPTACNKIDHRQLR